jgi:hypothetical protein
VVAISVASALAFATSTSLKHVSAGHAPDARDLNPRRLARFVHATVTHPLWLAGIACDVVGLALQIVALHLGALAIVQPLLLSGLLFALILRRFTAHHHIAARQLAWAAVLTGALSGFVLLATSSAQSARDQGPDRLPAIIAALIGTFAAIVCVMLGRRERSGGRSAALTGLAVGIIYATTAALLKGLSDIATHAPLHVLTSWQLYGVIALGACGVLLSQIAFQAGPLTASLPATATLDPLLSIAIGVGVFDEHIRNGAADSVLLVVLLATLAIAAVNVARSPDLTHSEGDS